MRRWKGMLGLLFVVTPLLAQDIPPALRDWQGWVLHDTPQHACPFLANSNPDAGSYQCIWPGRLTLDASKDGGHFSLDVHVDAQGWADLPGDDHSWPQQVVVNNKAWPVLNHEGHPAVRLEPGDYTVKGDLPWDTRPARLGVPSSIGLVSLNLDGNAVGRIERNGDQLTLGEAAAAQRQADTLSVRIYRHLTDGMPAMLETQLQLNVTGSAREQLLGPALPNGFIATALDSDVPAQLENDGRIRLQLRPGQWVVHVSARATNTLHEVSVTLPADPWPKQEVWSYSDDPSLRSTRVEGRGTDAAQAGVPQEWRDLPSYVLDGNDGLVVDQGTRGGEGEAADQIHLQREIWLDFDGRGFNISDHLTGSVLHTQRLDVGAPWQLQRATQGSTPLLITDTGQGRTGIELRSTDLNLHAGLRVPDRSGSLPSAGWLVSLENIDVVLHLPYGYRLIGASGVDRSPDSWVAQWSLLDLFVVALIALLAGRLLGWRWAALAALFLILSQHETGAPRWTLGLALAFALLMRALPSGRLRWIAQIAGTLALALAVLWTLPFAKTQLEDALHPQLEGNGGYAALMRQEAAEGYVGNYARVRKEKIAPVIEEQAEMVAAPTPPAPAPAEASAMPQYTPSSVSNRNLASVTVTGAAMPSSSPGSEIDSHSIIQAGAGEPSWDVDNNYRLGWSGPIAPEQSVRLVIAPAWLVRLLRVLMLGLLIGLLGRMARGLVNPSDASWRNWRLGNAAAACLLFTCAPHIAHAQAMPNQELLRQLQSRLLEAPKCVPDCAVVATANLQAKDDQVALELEVHVGAPIALPLPQVDAGLQLVSVNVDGRADATVSKRDEQMLARLEPGVHHIGLIYRVQPTDSTTLNFTLRPQWMVFNGQGWSLDGVDGGRLLGDSITLNRIQTVADGKQRPLPQQAFPPYVRITRDIVMGVDWTVVNTVERVAPSDGGFTIDVPLLSGEHPLGDSARVHDGRIGVTFNAGQGAVTWTSRLDHADTLKIEAPTLGDRAEIWQLHASPIWHVEAKGVPVSDSSDGLRFEPLPNETLSLIVSRPKAIDGDSLAFDSVNASANVGDRATETTLDLLARSTRGGEHAIALPSGTELLGATRDDDSLSLAVKHDKLSLPLLPGKHRYTIRLREPHGVGLSIATSAIALGAPSANIALDLTLPEDRWVLWTWGPSVGPAVLYWSQLVVLLLAAWLLGRYAPTPLRFHHWLLLGLGFSAFAWSAYAFVVVWLIIIGLRAKHDAAITRLGSTTFNLAQIALAAITVLALAVLVSAVPKGLLGLPDMHVAGNGSTAWALRWFADQAKEVLPQAGVFSVSLWFYKVAMLAWALWLANALIGWLRWGFDAWTKGGYWRKPGPKQSVPPPVPFNPAVDTMHDD